MAPDLRAVSITIYNKSGSIVLSIPSGDFYDNNTVGEVLEDSRVVALGITELSTAQGGTAAPHSNSLHNYTQSGTELNIVFYDVTPTPATLTSHGHIDTLHMRHIQETITDYSAMRGPCPEGFHIPLSSEWIATRGVLVGLGISPSLNGPQLSYLKIPATGSYQYGGSLARRNTVGQARCCDTYNGNGRSIYGFRDASWSNSSKSNVMVIRPRKDVPVVPDNTWTTIFDGSSVASGAGIFWKEDQQVISLSSDGVNWISISDRNVGSTKAGTSVDCVGKVFQRGNSYGFTYNGNSSAPTFPNRTSTKIDVSGYGPSEYSSSTYYDGGSNQDWASVANNDLRGGVTGPQTVTVDRREPVYYGPQPTLWTEAEILGATDLDTLMTELDSHPEEYYDLLLNGENCTLYDPCGYGHLCVMTKNKTDFLKICGKYIDYAPHLVDWQWQNSEPCPL